MPEFWSVMKKGSKSIIRFSGGSIWKQWERNVWRDRAAFYSVSVFMGSNPILSHMGEESRIVVVFPFVVSFFLLVLVQEVWG